MIITYRQVLALYEDIIRRCRLRNKAAGISQGDLQDANLGLVSVSLLGSILHVFFGYLGLGV